MTAIRDTFQSTLDVINLISNDATRPEKRVEAQATHDRVDSFHFVFILFMIIEALHHSKISELFISGKRSKQCH